MARTKSDFWCSSKRVGVKSSLGETKKSWYFRGSKSNRDVIGYWAGDWTNKELSSKFVLSEMKLNSSCVIDFAALVWSDLFEVWTSVLLRCDSSACVGILLSVISSSSLWISEGSRSADWLTFLWFLDLVGRMVLKFNGFKFFNVRLLGVRVVVDIWDPSSFMWRIKGWSPSSQRIGSKSFWLKVFWDYIVNFWDFI